MDANRPAALAAIESCYGKKDRLKWLVNWRLFFMACAELFGYAGGTAWGGESWRRRLLTCLTLRVKTVCTHRTFAYHCMPASCADVASLRGNAAARAP